MYRIMVVDNGLLDREITSDILSTGLRTVDVRTADSPRSAVVLQSQWSADLLIVDVPPLPLWASELVNEVRAIAPEADFLFTSVGREEDLARLTVKAGAKGYLLKPLRPVQLLKIVAPMAQEAAAAELELGIAEGQEALEKLTAAVKDCDYKKCTEVTKKYLAFLYETTDNKLVIRTRTLQFAEGIAALGDNFPSELRWKLTGCLERFRTRYDLQGRKYDACAIFEEMLDAIFEEMERGALYFGDSIKKVLNYIDRNIKKGINLDDAAKYVNMSSSYFSKFFKKETGINFITYVTDRKMEFAKEMLRDTELPVINIAYELSYSETNYFSKAFKKREGLTPTEYREQFRGEKPVAGVG